MPKHILTIIITILAFIFTSCFGNDEPDVKGPTRRTVVVYMVATNSLGTLDYDTKDINEMKLAIESIGNTNCRLLIYYTAYNSEPSLIEIKNTNGKAVTETLKTYSSSVYSTSIERMSEVFSDIETFAPATDYGLILWSHATGWVRELSSKSIATNSGIDVLDFGEDRKHQMSITELSEAIPTGMFSFIYADACYMGSIEIAYQLRNKTSYYIASPTETLGTGMPYDENIPCFFEETPNLIKACENTFNEYDSQTGIYRSITIALTDCSKLQSIAELCHDIHADPTSTEISPYELQKYNRGANPIYVDFLQYTSLLATKSQATTLQNILNDAIIYKACTPSFAELEINEEHFSGLSTYILGTSTPENETFYSTLDWHKDVYNH